MPVSLFQLVIMFKYVQNKNYTLVTLFQSYLVQHVLHIISVMILLLSLNLIFQDLLLATLPFKRVLEAVW